MKKARRLVFWTTIVAWLGLCWAFWRLLIRQAATAGDFYARTASFQLLNFAIQYLWVFLLLLAVVLFLEWVILWMIGAIMNRWRKRATDREGFGEKTSSPHE